MLRLFSMKYVLCAALCTWFCPDAFTQDIEKYVRSNITTITTIDTLSDNYDDLTDIGKAIGDARVVMLGEQDHGDAPAFLAKTRLVKYLHEKKGFNVLAFESDFYGLTSGWDNTVKQPDSIRHFLKRNIFMIWTYSDACQYLFNTYIPATFQRKEPLAIAGFDSQMYLDYSFSELTKDLNEYLTKAKLIDGFADSRTYRRFLDAVQGSIEKPRNPNAFNEAMNKDLKEGLRIIKKAQLDKQDDSYWSLIIDNLIAYANDSWGSTANNPLGSTVRDKAMANNLKFLVDKKYKGEKVIVWAANTHVMKYTDQLKSKAKFFDKVIFENMGTNFVKDSLSAAGTYVLGFASYRGEAGRLGTNQFSVEAPHKNGLENWMPGSAAYGFVDFKSYNSKFSSPTIPFFMKSPAHYTIPTKVVKVPWNLVYDGIFFIRDMYAAKEVK